MKSVNALSIAATGVNITTGAASANHALPTSSDGNVPNYCVISTTVACHVRWGQGTQTAVATDFYLPPNFPMVIRTLGCTNIAAIQDTAAGVLNVAPLEWVR